MTIIVTRNDKGSPLSYTEMDNNFINLNTDKVETSNPQTTGSLQHNGNVNLTGTSARITGDFSNATIANRAMFQTSTVNGTTSIAAIPNGTATGANFAVFNNSADPANSSFLSVGIPNTVEARVNSGITGSGTYLPMTFYMGGSERMRIDTSGNVGIGLSPLSGQGCFQSYKLVTGGLPATSGTSDPNQAAAINAGAVQLSFGAVTAGHNWIQARARDNFIINYDLYLQPNGGNTLHIGPNGGLGYGTGAGGTVTQATSKSTTVTLNKPTGQITMSNAVLGAGAWVWFQLNNSLLSASDVLVVNSNTNFAGYQNYSFKVATQIGNAVIGVKNDTAGSLSEAVVINFAIIKGATA